MTSYTFWHGRRSFNDDDDGRNAQGVQHGVDQRPTFASWLDHAISGLRQNTWTAPLYINGYGWERNHVSRQEAAVQLFEALGANTSCTSLVFQNATIYDAASHAFARCMASDIHSLKSITLRNLHWRRQSGRDRNTEDSKYSVPASLFEQAQNLETLSLTKVALNYEACVLLSRMLCNHKSSLKSLTLDEVHMDERGMLPFFAALVRTRSLQTLKVSNMCQASSFWNKKSHVQCFCLALSRNKSITTLNMDNMQLGTIDTMNENQYAASQALAKLLRTNQTLTQVSLRKNGLDGNAVQMLLLQQEGLLHNPKSALQELFLSRNALGDRGAAHLATFFSKQLQQQNKLHTLCLVDTKISHAGCVQIVQSLQQNTMVQKIVLDGNEIADLAPALLELLQHNNVHLTYVLDRLLALLARAQHSIASAAANYDNNIDDSNNNNHHRAWRQVDLLLRANKAGRRVLQRPNPVNLVPRVLARAAATTTTTTNPDVLFHLLQNHVAPELMMCDFPPHQPRSNFSTVRRSVVPSAPKSSSLLVSTSATTPVMTQRKSVAPSA